MVVFQSGQVGAAAATRANRYREYLESHTVRFGFPAEVAALSTRTRNGVSNDIPPVERWHNILPVLRVAERLREQFGPVTVHSAYRSRLYNLAVGGVGDSRHAQNDALDLSCAAGTPAEWATFLRGLRDAKVFTGGIGTYATFVHVDTRGTVANWVG